MATTDTAAAAGEFVASAQKVLDHLAAGRCDTRWAVSQVVGGHHEVLAVSERPAGGGTAPADGVVGFAPDGAVLARPLVGRDGAELGGLWALDAAPGDEPAGSVPLDLLADLLSTILESDLARVASARRSQLLHEQALSDELTGLLNRRGWTQVLEAEPSYPDVAAAPSVIVIDLDRLKEVNDLQGHVAGDEYLQLAAVTLSAACREGDLVARLGGDEFGVLVEGAGSCSASAARRLVERMREALDAAGVAASIGLAAYDPDGGLVRTWWQADRAMYAQKKRRRARVASAVVLA
ncbi:MAG: GGDEF domain-containing protein [Angustibacter sp.]